MKHLCFLSGFVGAVGVGITTLVTKDTNVATQAAGWFCAAFYALVATSKGE